jgi:hypothetical protein
MRSEKIYIFVLFLLTILLNIGNLNLPYYWDDFNYVIPAVDYVYGNYPTIFLWEYGLGHPPFFFIFSGLIFKFLGDSQIIGHSIILLFSFLTVLFTYLLGKELFSRKVGIIASLLLLFTPIFVSYSTLFYLEMPLTALTIMAIYFAVKNKPYPSVIFGSFAVLTKEIGILAALGIFIAKLIKEKNKMTERSLFSKIAVPVASFLIGFCGSETIQRHYLDNRIPRADQVQSSYAIPNKLEIKLEDLDGNGEKETIMRYDGKSYLLRLDSNGKPTVDAYEVRPAEVVPKAK